MSLTYRQHQLLTAFVFISKSGVGGVKLSELATALNLANNSASVSTVVDILVSCGLVRKVRMGAEPRRPYRIFAHPDAQVCAGAKTFEEWKAKH